MQLMLFIKKTGACDDVFWGGEPLCIRQEIKLNHFLLWMKKVKIPQNHSNPCHNQWIKTIGSIFFYWELFVLCHFMDESVVATTTTTTGMTFGSVPLSPQVICCTLCIKVYDAFKSFKLQHALVLRASLGFPSVLGFFLQMHVTWYVI